MGVVVEVGRFWLRLRKPALAPFVSWEVTPLAPGFVDSAVQAPALLVVFSAPAPQASAEQPWPTTQVPVGEVRALSPPVPDAPVLLPLSHPPGCVSLGVRTPEVRSSRRPGSAGAHHLTGAESGVLAPETWPLAELGAMGSGVSAGLTLLSLSGAQPPGLPYYTDPGGPGMNPAVNPMAMAFQVQPNSPQGSIPYPPPPSYCNTPPPPYEQVVKAK